MKKHIYVLVVLVVLFLANLACSVNLFEEPTPTPIPPTATPLPPTVTPMPTATPIPPTATPVPLDWNEILEDVLLIQSEVMNHLLLKMTDDEDVEINNVALVSNDAVANLTGIWGESAQAVSLTMVVEVFETPQQARAEWKRILTDVEIFSGANENVEGETAFAGVFVNTDKTTITFGLGQDGCVVFLIITSGEDSIIANMLHVAKTREALRNYVPEEFLSALEKDVDGA